MLIIRRLNFIDAAYGIVTLTKWPSGGQVEREQKPCTGRPLTESDDSGCCINKIQPPGDERIMLKTCSRL